MLLRLQRAETVLGSLFYHVHKYGNGQSSKEGIDLHAKKASRNFNVPDQTKLSSLFDGEAYAALRHLRFCMSWFVAAMTRYVLDTAIRRNWAVMRRRLEKLRRRAHINVNVESRPMTPAEDEDFEDLDGEVVDVEVDEDDRTQLGTLSQLQSAHSIVLYHHVIMNRILRACLLSPQPGHQITFKILMSLLSLVLDLGKTVKEVERGGDVEEGARHVMEIRLEWNDKLAVFVSNHQQRVKAGSAGAGGGHRYAPLERASLAVQTLPHVPESVKQTVPMCRGHQASVTGAELTTSYMRLSVCRCALLGRPTVLPKVTTTTGPRRLPILSRICISSWKGRSRRTPKPLAVLSCRSCY